MKLFAGRHKVKVNMQFIDNKGFIHFATAKSKKRAVESLKTLREGTEIRWASPTIV